MPGHGHRNGHVDAHHAHLDASRKLAGHTTVAGEAGHPIAKLVVVNQLHGLGKVLGTHAGQHRSKDLFLVDAHVGLDVVEQRAAGEKALLQPRHAVPASIHHQLRPFGHTDADVVLDAITRLTRDNGSHLRVKLHAVFDFQGARTLGQQRHDALAHVAHQHRHRDGHAALSRRTISTANERVHRLFDIRIRHHHHVVLGTS